MAMKKRWVVEGSLEGGIHIPETSTSLSADRGMAALTRYAFLEQDLHRWPWPRLRIFLGLEIPDDRKHVCVAYQEMEAFARTLAIEKNRPISIEILGMTDKPESWPQGIEFLEARDFSACSGEWQPVDHFKDPKNRVLSGMHFRGLTPATESGVDLERRHEIFSKHDNYKSELVKDYIAGLDAEDKHPALAMLYYFKVLERVGRHEHGDPESGAMKKKTMGAIFRELGAQLPGFDEAKAQEVLRWRHRKSEAHLVTEGAPTRDELLLCKDMAYLLIVRRVT